MPDRPPAAIAAQAARASADEPAPKAAFTDRWLEPTSTAFGAPVQIVPQETPQAPPSASGAESSMVATVEVLTGKKSVLDYLVKPARMLGEEALRER